MQIIYIHPHAPVKPALYAPCNGCGVCCLAEPCPVGMFLSHQRRGACKAVRWDGAGALYRCGAIVSPQQVVRDALPSALGWLSPILGWVLQCAARRWIAVGIGCDSSLTPNALTNSLDSVSADD